MTLTEFLYRLESGRGCLDVDGGIEFLEQVRRHSGDYGSEAARSYVAFVARSTRIPSRRLMRYTVREFLEAAEDRSRLLVSCN